jgi:hypothetical protein
LEINLILHHLLGVGLESVDFITKWLFLFFHFVVVNLQFAHSQWHFFALGVFILIGFEKLALGVFVLFIVVLEVSEFTVKFIQIVFVFLNNSLGLVNSGQALGELVFLLSKKWWDLSNSLFVVLDFWLQNWVSLLSDINILINVELDFSEFGELLVVGVADFLLFSKKSILVLDFFSQVQVGLVFNAWLLSQAVQFWWLGNVFTFSNSNHFQKFDLFVFSTGIIGLDDIKFSDESVNFGSVLTNSGKAVTFESGFLLLSFLVLVLEISILFSQSLEISWSVFDLIDFSR